jgi:hypothetical protein
MNIVDLAQDAWTMLLSYLKMRHIVRLVLTGDAGVQWRIRHSPLTLESTYMVDVYGGSLKNLLMPNATSLTATGTLRMRLDCIDFSSYSKLKSLDVTVHDKFCSLTLPPNLTSLSLVVFSALNMRLGQFGETVHLQTLSFIGEADWLCFELLATEVMVWPPNLTDLTIKYAGKSQQALDASVGSDLTRIKFPPTLVRLELNITPRGWISSAFIKQCPLLEVIKIGAGRTAVFNIDWSHFPNARGVHANHGAGKELCLAS